MRPFEFSRCAFGITAAVASLSACGGASMPRAFLNTISDVGALKHNQTFHYTGKKQTFIVPAGVSQLTVVAHGGEGAGFNISPSTDTPGFPGRVRAIIPVHPGDTLYVFVGGSGTHGGFNGGGAGGTSGSGSYSGNPGGGASDVRAGGDKVKYRILVAAGGGGSGEAVRTYGFASGGNGGGLAGQPGGGGGSSYSAGGGAGGTQRGGGSGGSGGPCYNSSDCGQPGGNGALGLGGNGGAATCLYSGGGGGAGGGYYGGGGGGGGGANYFYMYGCAEPGQGGGGGGGSSYAEPSAIKSRMWTGWKVKGDGLVVFSWN
ncbi:MAG: hypothetical protein WAM84_00065 [Candidatus Cybelea sp.]